MLLLCSYPAQKALTDGNSEGALDIDAPRQSDGVRALLVTAAHNTSCRVLSPAF